MRRSWLKRITGRVVTVHTTLDQSIVGILLAEYDDGVLLRKAGLLKPGGERTEIAGEVFVLRERVALVTHG